MNVEFHIGDVVKHTKADQFVPEGAIGVIAYHNKFEFHTRDTKYGVKWQDDIGTLSWYTSEELQMLIPTERCPTCNQQIERERD